MFGNNFYDKYGNFNNEKIVKLLQKARKQKINKKIKKTSSLNINLTIFQSISKKEVWEFINKFSIFINSGVDVKSALTILTKQIKNQNLKKIIIEIKEGINQGISISESMGLYPKVFNTLTVALISVGEKTGKLGFVLNELDSNLLESIELKAKVKGAILYPIILFTLTIIMVIFMMVFIVPKIILSFEKAGSDLPGLTQIIVDISNFLINDYLIIILSIIGFIIFIKIIGSTYIGKIALAKIATKTPIFGYLIRQSNIIYFIKSFTILLDSGVLLLESLNSSSKVVSNLAYKKELIRIKNEVEVGIPISKSLGLNPEYQSSIYLNKLFPEEFAYIINVGEETGTLSESLKKIGVSYNSELKRYISNISSIIEPVIIVVVGFLVGTIVVAIMLPFFEIGKIAKNL